MNLQGVRVRFAATLAANILRAAIAFVTGLAIARCLGPSDYGNFRFLLGSFGAIAAAVEMATSSAFFTFIAARPRGVRFYRYYAVWMLLQLLILASLVAFSSAALRNRIWLGHTRDLIMLALTASFAQNQIWRFVGQIGEAVRDTVGVQFRNLSLMAAYLIMVLLLGWFELLTLKWLYIVNSLLYIIFSVGYVVRLRRLNPIDSEIDESPQEIFAQFWDYCLPLALYTWVNFFYAFADFWLLQRYGGPRQQGFYQIGSQFSTVALIATTSMVQVLWKEIAEAHALGQMDRVRRLYESVLRGLYYVGCLISCYLVPMSREIIHLFLGAKYATAWLPLALMLLFPVHQSMGQISGTMLLAIGRTRTKSIIGIIFMALSILVAYLMLAPSSSIVPGLALGAVGLAIKMVICQFFEVNLTLFFTARYIRLPYHWVFQFGVLSMMLTCGYLCKLFVTAVMTLLSQDLPEIAVMIASAAIYFPVAIAVTWTWPGICGLDRRRLRRLIGPLQQHWAL